METNESSKLAPPVRLNAQAVNVTSWLAGVVALLWRLQPYTLMRIVVAAVLSRFARLAAFLLPLKVLLLAASDGIPSYFRLMADPEDKPFWIIGLTIAAIVVFLLGRFLEAFAEKLSEAGSLEVMKEANQLALVGNQESVGRRHFTSIATLCADLVFVAVAYMTIAAVNPLLGGCLAVFVAFAWVFTALLLAKPWLIPHLAERILKEPRDYLQDLSHIGFWLGFVAILVPFLVGAGGNILFAILAFVLVRQMLSALVAAVRFAVDLSRERSLIDALISPSHQLQRDESSARRTWRALFQRDTHLAKLESVLSDLVKSPGKIAIRWKDSPIGGVSTFGLTVRSGRDRFHYEEQVYAPYQAHLIKNEEVLFAHIPRELLGAPLIRAKFVHGPYQCRLCDSGLGVPAPATRWLEPFLEKVWGIAPPDELVLAFRTSHTLLHERLNRELLSRLAVAVGSKREAKTLRAFKAELPSILAALAEVPLYVATRDTVVSNTAVRRDNGVALMMWGRWVLAPLASTCLQDQLTKSSPPC